MLNYNKIHSLINFDRTSKRSLAKYLEIGESTFRSRLERKNFTPDDVEKIAEFFEKPIAYFFDKEENEPAGGEQKKCKECEKKEAEIIDLRQQIYELNVKLAVVQDKYINLLEAHDAGKDLRGLG